MNRTFPVDRPVASCPWAYQASCRGSILDEEEDLLLGEEEACASSLGGEDLHRDEDVAYASRPSSCCWRASVVASGLTFGSVLNCCRFRQSSLVELDMMRQFMIIMFNIID